MWRGLMGSLGPCRGGGIAGMAVGFQWCSPAARVYRAAVIMWWACPSTTMWRKVYSVFSTVFLSLVLLAVGVGFPAACFWR